MKSITIVYFRAYDRPLNKMFINSTAQQIHEHLKGICFTYQPTKIYTGSISGELPLTTLTDLINNEQQS